MPRSYLTADRYLPAEQHWTRVITALSLIDLFLTGCQIALTPDVLTRSVGPHIAALVCYCIFVGLLEYAGPRIRYFGDSHHTALNFLSAALWMFSLWLEMNSLILATNGDPTLGRSLLTCFVVGSVSGMAYRYFSGRLLPWAQVKK
ncbi:hypothetical protein F5Y14DRAFT_396415 [Nemania sp. NC0429]|nr:hypothetical protein F5Y14DRAFT_396415 [Nemania sp. NC0429]